MLLELLLHFMPAPFLRKCYVMGIHVGVKRDSTTVVRQYFPCERCFQFFFSLQKLSRRRILPEWPCCMEADPCPSLNKVVVLVVGFVGL